MNFRIGQRVRIARVVRNTDVLGREAVVTAVLPEDCFRLDIIGMGPPPYGYWCAYGWKLEPLYDGNTKVSWDDCAWKPEGVAA